MERIKPIVCSATEIVFPPGTFATTIPFCVAACLSTLSTPVPALPINFNFCAAAIISAVTLTSERIIRPS